MFTLKNLSLATLQDHRYLLGGSLLLLITVSYLLIKMTISSNSSVTTTMSETKSARAVPTMLSQQDIQRLLSWNLFGQSVITIAPTKSLSFTITGIMQSTIAQRTGILVMTQGQEKIYSPGERLPNGDRFEKVDGERIIISHEGKLQAIVFDQKSSGTSSEAYVNYSSDSDSDADNNYSNSYDDNEEEEVETKVNLPRREKHNSDRINKLRSRLFR